MRRLVLVAAVAVGIIAAWWLAEDSDLRQQLTAAGEAVLQKARGGGPPPSWGDVAERVGEFAKEEQGLKQTVGRLDAESAKVAAPPADPAAQ